MSFGLIYILILCITFVEKTPYMCYSIDDEIKEKEQQMAKAEKLVQLEFPILNRITDEELKKDIKNALKSHILREIDKRSVLQIKMEAKLNATIDNCTRLLEDNIELLHATLTREAYEQTELTAFPPGLYYSDLKKREKWLVALMLYDSPALNYIRRKLREWNIPFGQFAEAAEKIHQSISSTFSHPKLAHYTTPKNEQEIVKYCSFLHLLQKNDEEPESGTNTRALELACISAWQCSNYPRAGSSSDNDELTTYHIVLKSSKLLSAKEIEKKFTFGIEKQEKLLRKKLVFNKTVTILQPFAENKKDPKATIHSNEKKYIFSVLCSIDLDPDKLKNNIDQPLQKGFMHFNDIWSTSILKTESATTSPKDDPTITSPNNDPTITSPKDNPTITSSTDDPTIIIFEDDYNTSSEEYSFTRGGFP